MSSIKRFIVCYTLLNQNLITISESQHEAEVDLLDLSDDKKIYNICANSKGDTCDDDEFYKLQAQFQDLNIKTITSDNVIELLKEVTDDKTRKND